MRSDTQTESGVQWRPRFSLKSMLGATFALGVVALICTSLSSRTPPARETARAIRNLGGDISLVQRSVVLTVLPGINDDELYADGLRIVVEFKSIDDATFKMAVPYLRRIPNLSRLILRNTKITDITLDEIAHLNRVLQLDLRDTLVSQTGVERFVTTCPKCTVDF